MVTLRIDDETFAFWSKQAAAQGLSVQEWLKTATADQAVADEDRDWPVEERLRRFDSLIETVQTMNTGSGGMLDDSRETIYGDRGL